MPQPSPQPKHAPAAVIAMTTSPLYGQGTCINAKRDPENPASPQHSADSAITTRAGETVVRTVVAMERQPPVRINAKIREV